MTDIFTAKYYRPEDSAAKIINKIKQILIMCRFNVIAFNSYPLALIVAQFSDGINKSVVRVTDIFGAKNKSVNVREGSTAASFLFDYYSRNIYFERAELLNKICSQLLTPLELLAHAHLLRFESTE